MTTTESTDTKPICRWCARRGTECDPILCDRCGVVRCPSGAIRSRLCVVCQPQPEVERALTVVVAERVREAIADARRWARGRAER